MGASVVDLMARAAKTESGHQCSFCEQELYVGSSIVVLTIVGPPTTVQGVQTFEVLDDEGDYAYYPHHFHEDCWVELYNNCHSRTSDKKPVTHPGESVECDICQSSILGDEKFGKARLGELQISLRQPNGKSSLSLKRTDSSNICLACIANINSTDVTMWEDAPDQDGECEEGLQERCWRMGCKKQCRYDLSCRNCGEKSISVIKHGGLWERANQVEHCTGCSHKSTYRDV